MSVSTSVGPRTDAPVPFAIAGPAELRLGPERIGATSFTVTNLTGRPIRVRLQPRAAAPGNEAWYQVTGEREVPMAVGATLSVEVMARVPGDAPEGTSTLSLRAVDEADPERLTDGPAVAVTVPPPPPPPKKLPLVPILAAVLVLVLLGGGAFWFFAMCKQPPLNPAAPTIPDTAMVGVELKADVGRWERKPELTYQWFRCTGSTCEPIDDATADSYVPTVPDATLDLQLQVTGTNEDGALTASSNRSRVAQAPPRNTTLPALSGTPETGRTLTLDVGTWDDAVTIEQQWMSCPMDDASACTPIAGATGTTLLVGETLTAQMVRADVTATNPGGTMMLSSNTLGPIGVAKVPVPLVLGLQLGDGQTLIDALGLTANVIGQNSWCSVVLTQSIQAGTLVERGTAVTLTVAYQQFCLFLPDLGAINDRYLPFEITIPLQQGEGP